MRALNVVSSIISSLRRFSVFLRMWQPYPNYRMNLDLRSPIFPRGFCAPQRSPTKIRRRTDEVAIGSDGCGARVAAQYGLDQFRPCWPYLSLGGNRGTSACGT